MSNVFIEFKKNRNAYVATQRGTEIAHGPTQENAIEGARSGRQNPEDPMLAERQRLRNGRPHPDKWRRVY